MALSITVVLRKDKINAQGLAPVCIRITKDRKTSYITTDLKLEERYWDGHRVKKNYPNSVQINNYLDKLRME